MIRSRTPLRTLVVAAISLAAEAGCFAAPALPIIPSQTFFVTNYGAIGDGVVTNTSPIQNSINAASAAGGGMVRITPGVFLSGPLALSNYINLQIDAGAILRMLPYDKYPGTDAARPNFISASGLHDLQISGSGAIDGQGAPWWLLSETNSAAKRPNMITLSSCSKILIQDTTLSNSPSPFIAIKGNNAGNVTIQGITVKAPPSSGATPVSHNTDAIDLAETNALIANCSISTGDDNLAVGSSAGLSRDILVTNCFFGDGHGCSIGSYTSSGVSNLTVINCAFSGTDNGIRLKSQRGRGGVVQNCNYYNLTMTNVDWPLLIYSYYEYGLGTITGVDPAFAATTAATNPTTLTTTTPIWRNITFSNITATVPSGRPPLMVWGLPESPASNIVFRSVNITSSSTRIPGIYNATNLQFIDCSFSLPSGVKTVQFWNADMTFSNSAPLSNLLLLDGITTNGLGNSLKFYNARASIQKTNAIDDGPVTLSGSTLTISNNLTLYPSSVWSFVLGTNNSQVAVVGNLSLGGTNNLYAGPGLTNATYTNYSYTGGLTWGNPALGVKPAGYSYAWDTNTAGQVKLLVRPPLPATPTNVAAWPSNLLVRLTWSPSIVATSYNVKRSATNTGPFILIGSGSVTTNLADGAVTNRLPYYYVVSAVNAAGESADSAPVFAIPQPSTAPVTLSTVSSPSLLQVFWPGDHQGWRIEGQTNPPGVGLGTNWQPIDASMIVTQMAFPVGMANGSAFFRLIYP